MPNTRFAVTNDNMLGPVYSGGSVAPVLINGNGGYSNPPALEQDAAFPMSNVLTADRYLPWKTSASPPPGDHAVVVDIDLGAQRTVQCVSLHGFRTLSVPEGLVARPFWFQVRYQVSSYNGFGSWTSWGPETDFGQAFPYRDSLVEPGGTVSFRYLRLAFQNASASPFSVGRVFVTGPPRDLGRVYSPGSSQQIVFPALITDNMAMGPVVTIIGDAHDEFDIQLDAISDATLAVLELLRRTRGSFIYYRHTGAVRECIIAGMHSTVTHTFGPPALYSVRLSLLALA